MKFNRKSALPLVTGAMLGMGAASAQAADLEFYFPVGVNAPAVATIEALTNAWAEKNPQHTVKAVYAGNYEETTTKALTAAQAGQPPQVAVLLAIDIFTLVRRALERDRVGLALELGVLHEALVEAVHPGLVVFRGRDV